MPVRPTYYQRVFHRHSFLSSASHSTRASLTRRHCSDRVCLLLIFTLLFYIGWYVFLSPNRVFQLLLDPVEEIAYKQALNRSSPILENVQLCSSQAIDLLFVIISSSSSFLDRQAIRETWASMPDVFGVHSQRLFVIGHHYGGKLYRDLMQEESHQHDLLYLTASDSSRTLIELSAYRWLQQHCSNVKYIFKTEDDLFVNSFLLHDLVRELKNPSTNTTDRKLHNVPLDTLVNAQTSNAEKFLFGWAYQPGLPERHNTASPYFVSLAEFPDEKYPRYCSGFGYLFNSQTRNILVAESLKDNHPFRFADIYFTGIIPNRLGFACEALPYTYHQGSADACADLIRKSRQQESSSPPLILCSTGRHVGHKIYSDYYQMWTELRQIYNDQLGPKLI